MQKLYVVSSQDISHDGIAAVVLGKSDTTRPRFGRANAN